MRVWDIAPSRLCRQHLLGEHREIHAVWNVITLAREGYSRHPETMRWRGRLRALYERHEAVAGEMSARGYAHRSPLDKARARGRATQDRFVNTRREQIAILRLKGCACRTD